MSFTRQKTEVIIRKVVAIAFIGILIISNYALTVSADVGGDPADTTTDNVVFSESVSNAGNTGYEPAYYYMGGIVCSANGNLFIFEKDIGIKARGFNIEIIRSYNSHRSGNLGPFGFGWTHNYNIKLVENLDDSVTLYDGDGSKHIFISEGAGVYTPPDRIHSKLRKNIDGSFVLLLKDGSRYNFNSYGVLLNIEDKNGNRLTFSYLGDKLTRVEDDSGLNITINYHAGKISSIVDPIGRQIRYEYLVNDLVEVTDAMGNSSLYLYYDNHKLKGDIDRVDSTTLFSYTDGNKVKDIKKSKYDRSTGTYITPFLLYSFEYDNENMVVNVIDAMGHKTSIKHNNLGNPTKFTDSLSSVTRMGWDGDMNMVSSTDANSHTTVYEYDSYGNLIKETKPLGHSTIVDWQNVDSDLKYISLLVKSTNAKGFSTLYNYDSMNNLIRITDATGNSSSLKYDAFGYVIEEIDFRGNNTLYSYDTHGSMITSTDAIGSVKRYEYDAVGRLVSITDAIKHTTSYLYDDNDRLIKLTDALGNEQKYYYNAAGSLLYSIDANGHRTGVGSNIIGKVDEITDASDNKTSFLYDKNGNLIKYTNAKGANTTTTYDALGRVVSTTDALGNTEHYTYDASGNMVGSTDANGKTTYYVYDELNRLIRESSHLKETVTYSYDALGNLVSVHDSKGNYSVFYGCDALDQIVSVTTDYVSFSKTVAYSYDANGNRATMTDPNGLVTRYEYDANNRLIRIIDPSGGVTSYVYNDASRRVKVAYPNGVTTSYTYDSANRLLSLVNKKSSSKIVISSYFYTYDNVGNKLSMTESDGTKTSYEYDSLYRLTNVTTIPSKQKIQYTYDEVGNRLTETSGSSTELYTYDSCDRLLTVEGAKYSYDHNGNLIGKAGLGSSTAYTYDYKDRLISVTLPDESQIVYEYIPTGERLSRADESGVTYYLYDFEDVLMELDLSGTVVAGYVHGPGIDEPISMSRGSTKVYYLFDGLGSVTSLTDSSESLLASYKYEPFGKILEETGSIANPYRFTGREYDGDTGLYYYRARYYDAEVGRFLSEDPIGAIDGPNLYVYVKNNPITLRDPFGLFRISKYTDDFVLSQWIDTSLDLSSDIFKDSNIFDFMTHTKLGIETVVDIVEYSKEGDILKAGILPSAKVGASVYVSGAISAASLSTVPFLLSGILTGWSIDRFFTATELLIDLKRAKDYEAKTYDQLNELLRKMGRCDLIGSDIDSINAWLNENMPSGSIPGGGSSTSPGGDHPDDNYDISILSSSQTSPFSHNSESDIAILSRGFYDNLAALLNEFGEDCPLVGINTPIEDLNNYPILIIPSGGLYGLDSSPSFKSKLEQYVNNGGTLIVFTQQHGYEFNALPGGEVSGYGWLEDQSCQHASIGIATYHPILSGQDSVTSDANVDGYFTKYPKNATILLSRTKNGMPAMLMYEFGNGTVIAATAYTDWAYGHSQATTDAKKLVRDMIAWAKSSEDIKSYGAGDTISIPVNITSYIDLTAERVVFTLIDPDNKVVDTVEVVTSVQPYETKVVDFTTTAPPQYGIFHIDYSLVDDGYGEVEQVQDAKMFAVSQYAENPDGWVWQGSELTFAVTSTQELFAYGEEGLLTLHVWNDGDTDRTIRVDYHRPHHGFWEIEDSVEIFAPAHGEGTSVVSLRMFVSGDIFYTYFYDENNNRLGGAKYPIYVYRPSVYIDIETDENEYLRGEDVFILLDLIKLGGISRNNTVTVGVLDPDNSKIFENTFSVNLSASTYWNKTFNFTLPVNSELGVYFITAEAYSNGNKIGSSSTYFKVSRDYIPKINFDNPDKTYRVRENMNINLEVKNVGSALWSSGINISIPVLAFEDSINISLNPNETIKINYNLSIPETTPAGKHDVIVTVDFDNFTKHFSFFIPDSNLISILGKTSYNASDNLSLDLTNIGGVDTTYNCSIKIYDSNTLQIYENNTVQKLILAGENKSIMFKIPDQAITGIYYLIVEYKNLNTVSKPTKLIKTYNINGLEASLATVTDKKVYFNDENVSILTNITNLDGEIVNGRLNLKILSYDSTIKSSSFTKANINQIMPFSETITDIDYNSSDLMTYEPYRHSIPLNELKDVLPNPASHEYNDSVFDLEPPTEMGNYDYHKTSIDNSGNVSASIASLSSNIWHVPNDYPTILAAVNAASAGDTIIVKDGTYTENINVNKPLTIRSENGSTNCIVNAADTNNHVFKVTANYVNISGFTLRGAFGLYSSHAGIYLGSEHCNISNNNASNNAYGIYLGSSNNNTLTSNSASNNTYGIFLSSSNNNTLRNNLMSGSLYNFGVMGGYSELENDIDTSNLMDGKSIYYLVGSTGTVIDSSSNAGTVYCINCNNITVKDLNFSNNTHGIYFISTNHSRIENVNASNSWYGINLRSSNNNTLTNNHISNSYLISSHSGIYLADSNNNTLTNNHISNNALGLWVEYSSNNTLKNNSASNNTYGIFLRSSSYSTLRNNLISGSLYNFGVWGSLTELEHDIDTSNLVDGKPIYYLVGSSGTVVDSSSNAGIVYCINCNNITVKDLICTNNTYGIYFFNTTNSRIQSNYINKTEEGIFLYYSYNNTLANNTACSNQHYTRRGIHLRKSNNNMLINNTASSSNSCGIDITYSNNNTLRKNNASNSKYGIWLYHSINNILVNNHASSNDYGIYLRSSSKYNNIINNTILNNWGGVHLSYSSNNLLYNNYFNNRINAFDNGNNIWNTTKTSGTNIVGGPWLGGNYWNDYKGIDIDGDGLGDTLIPYNCSGNIQNGGDYLSLVPVEPEPLIGKIIWETNITINMDENATKNIVTDVPMDVLRNITGKLELIATFYNHINLSQTINQSNIHSFFITDKNTSLILETDKRVYKPNETITIFGKVKNNATIVDDYNFSITKEGEEIFFDSFMLSSGETYDFNTTTTFNTSFTLEGTANDVVVTDFIKVEPPTVNVSVIAPEVVSLGDFDVGILIENIGDVPADLNVCIKNNTWNITVIEKESKLIQNKMNITKNTTFTVNISGDVNKTIQKEIICGDNAKINITPESTYLDGTVDIPYTIDNFGILDSKFNATFSIDNKTISESFFVPKGQNITDTVSFNLSKGAHLLKYTSPFEKVNATINVLSPPEFVVTSIHPEDMNFIFGQNVTMTFIVENLGGTEGEVTLRLLMPDFEDTNRTWVRPGEKENISFNFIIPDDLEENSYKGIYELDGKIDEFNFFVQGAKISVNASLDKNLYEEGETATLTLDITNECPFDLSMYTRVKLSDYEEIKQFNLTDFETLQFDVPVHFNGQKLFYGIYMESGRALYLNGMYVHKKEIITLYTDKQVYNAGENVTVFVDTTKSGTLNLTAPEFNKSMLLTGSTAIEFTLPEEMRSGTYYIEYDFDNFSSAYPFDVIGYSARILECSLDKEVYDPVDIVNVKMNVEVNQNTTGVLKTWIYNSESNLIDTFETDVNFQEGENKIALSRKFSSDHSGIYVLSYGIYAPNDLIFLASGAEYFDVMSQNTPPSSITNLHSTPGPTWLNWTWLNPSDPDFNHTEIYLNGTFQTITTAEHYNATGLIPNTIYTISTRTADIYGNINLTWVNDTATTLPEPDINPLIITITSPFNNTTYNIDSVDLNYSANVPTAWQAYSLDGTANITLHENTTLTNLTDGEHTLTVYANDTSGNMNSTTVWFTIDTIPPAGITNLQHMAGQTWINWTWTNPPDPDFKHTEIYMNGSFQTNTSAELFNATRLTPGIEYTISTRTVDTSGNINPTWVSDTATTLKLYNISFLPPITTMDHFNLTYGRTLPIKFTARDNDAGEFIYDDTVNVTITNSTGYLITYFTNGTGTDSVRINTTEEQYIVNFHTKDYDLNVGETYAITVTFGEPDSLRDYDITYFTLVEKERKGQGEVISKISLILLSPPKVIFEETFNTYLEELAFEGLLGHSITDIIFRMFI